jgi:cation diffusion facilitator family transporter
VLASELLLRSLRPDAREVVRHGWGLALMLGVLCVNAGVSWWETTWARRLDSDLLRADARHTASDVLVTLTVIAGWQLAAAGYAWLDKLATAGVGLLILALAWGLFRRAIPVLVERSAADPEELAAVVREVAGVRATRRVRSLATSGGARIDVTLSVDGRLSTVESHAIADRVERALVEHFAAADVTVHVEPWADAKDSGRTDDGGAR